MRPRHRIVVFHEDEAVREAVVVAAEGWRVLRAASLAELERVVASGGIETVVADGWAHDGSVFAVLDVLTRLCTTPRVLLLWSRPPDAFALSDAFAAAACPVYLQTADGGSLRCCGPQVRDGLRESLYRLRLAPYAATLPALCVGHLGLAGTPFELLPGWLVRRPWSCRARADLASALDTEVDALLDWSQRLGYERTEWVAFRIRAYMAAFLVVIDRYSWPEARETFGDLDGSNFRRRLNHWFRLEVSDLEAEVRGALAPSNASLRVVPEPDRERARRSYRPDLKSYRIGP